MVHAESNGAAVAHQFTVHYLVERVLSARDISDALRQAQALGAEQVLAIVRAS